MSGPRRPVALAVMAGLLIAGGVIDRVDRATVETSVSVDSAEPTRAEPDHALSSTWFCVAGSANPGGPADAVVSVANTSTSGRTGTITVIPTEGKAVKKELVVPARSRVDVRYADVLQAPWAASLVELDGGGVTAEQEVVGPDGRDVTACSRTASDTWHFASGSTGKDASMLLAFLNPFPDSAILDLRFATDDGTRVPASLQGVVVGPQALVLVDVGEHVRRRDEISTTVTARSGQVVASRLQRFSGAGRAGLGLNLGAVNPSRTWYFPEGLVLDGIRERYELYNPGKSEAIVELALAVEEGEAEPFELTVPANGRLALVASQEERIPKGKAHAVTVRSINSEAVVVEQTVDAGPPSFRSGFAATLGATETARRWSFAAGAATEQSDQWIVVHNPSTQTAAVSVFALAQGQKVPLEGLQNVQVAAGARKAWRLSDKIRRPALSVLVEADQGVVVSRGLYAVGGRGLSSTVGIALR